MQFLGMQLYSQTTSTSVSLPMYSAKGHEIKTISRVSVQNSMYFLMLLQEEGQAGSKNGGRGGSIRGDGSIKLFAGRRREKIAPINRKLHPREEGGGREMLITFLLNIDNWKKRQETVENAIPWDSLLSGDI